MTPKVRQPAGESPAFQATLACLLEVSAPKPGNVHRGADFDDATFNDFLISASILGDTLQRLRDASLGATVLEAVSETRRWVGSNTNLGLVLLLTPMVKFCQQNPNRELSIAGMQQYLQTLSQQDGGLVFRAIGLASPGGLGKVDQLDVRDQPAEVDLLTAMSQASDRDAVARQYRDGFAAIFESGIHFLRDGLSWFSEVDQAIVYAHVAWMAMEPDTLIARKSGLEVARQSQTMAQLAIDGLAVSQSDGGAPSAESKQGFWERVGQLDFWLRSDGRRRNPGTTADLIGASLFAALRLGILIPEHQLTQPGELK